MLSFSTRRQLPVLAGVMLVCAAWPACAETAPSFDQLLREAERSPRLALIAAEIERAQGLAIQAQARPNPTVSVMAENFAGGSPYNGFDRAETTVQFSQPIELGGKRAARISAAEAEIIAARARGREGRLAYATELARTYAVADVAKRRVAHAREEVEAAGAVLQLARAVVAAGKEAKLREVQALAELSTRQAALLRAQANLTTALGRLSVLAGAEEPITDIGESLLARLEVPTTMGPPDPLANVAYLAAQAEVAAAAGRLEAEQRRTAPDITVHVGTRRLEGENATALVAGVSVPLPLFDRNQGNIAVARADLRSSEARAQMLKLEASTTLQSAIVQVDAAAGVAAAAVQARQAADESFRLARLAYEAGKAPLAEVLSARRGVALAEDATIDALYARFEAQAALARATGLTITGDPVQ